MDIRTKLYDLASQENCDGEPYDTMQDAADYIAQLEKERDELRAHNDYLLNECHVFTDAALAEIKAQAIEDAAKKFEGSADGCCPADIFSSDLYEYANKLRESV
jgi:hypothetical protein